MGRGFLGARRTEPRPRQTPGQARLNVSAYGNSSKIVSIGGTQIKWRFILAIAAASMTMAASQSEIVSGTGPDEVDAPTLLNRATNLGIWVRASQ